MADHLTTHTLDDYRRGRLTAAELLAVDDHIAGCAVCREMWRQSTDPGAALSSLRASVQSAEHRASPHLTDVELTDYANGRMDAIDRELSESHLETCHQCRQMVAKLLSDANVHRC